MHPPDGKSRLVVDIIGDGSGGCGDSPEPCTIHAGPVHVDEINRRSQRIRLMIRTESPNDMRPRGLVVPAHDADGH